MPSSTIATSISSAMRRTISVRCSRLTTSRTVTRSSTSKAASWAERGVEALAVLLERLQGLVGAGEEQPRGQQRALLVAEVDGDRVARLRHRHDRHAERARHPLGRAVPGAGLRRGDRGVGHQVHVGPCDAAGVVGQDDGAVHLGQLRQPLGRERGVEQEAAGADRQHRRVVADHDQGAEPGLADPVEALA